MFWVFFGKVYFLTFVENQNDMAQPKKIIVVTGCNTNCPLRSTCQVWKKLNPNQRISLTIGVNVPHDFILKDCPLDDAGGGEVTGIEDSQPF